MFLVEGFCLGAIGALAGNILGIIIILILNRIGITFDFGLQKDSSSRQPLLRVMC